MALFILLVISIVWLLVASLFRLVQRQGFSQGEIERQRLHLLRALVSVRFGLALLYWLLSVIAVAELARQIGYVGAVSPIVMIIVIAVVAEFAARHISVQERVFSLVLKIHKKWGRNLDPAAGTILRICNSLGQRVFPEQPLFRDKVELTDLVHHHQRAHQIFTPGQLRQIERLLKLENLSVQSKIIPLKQATMVKAEDTAGPLLLAELHDSPYGSFAVYDKRRAKIIGTLEQGVAMSHAKNTAKISSLIDERIVYLPRTASYQQALVTFAETSSALSVIIDENNLPVGVLYVQDIIKDLFEKTTANDDMLAGPPQ